MNRLGRRKIGMQPDLVTSLQVRHRGDGQGLASARHMDVNLGSGKVKTASCLRVKHSAGTKECSEDYSGAEAAGNHCHHSILDGAVGLGGCNAGKGVLFATDDLAHGMMGGHLR